MSIDRRTFLAACAAATTAAAAPSWATTSAAPDAPRAPMIDALASPGGLSDGDPEPLNAQELADVAASGLTAIHVTVGTVGTMPPLSAFEKALRSIAYWDAQIARAPTVFAAVRGAADLDAAAASGRTGLIYGLQDGVAFEDDLGRLDALHRFGIRVIQPTYNRRNLLGDGSMEPADAGLSRTGLDAIARMNELGILVDLSHCGRRTAADAIAASKRPVAFTHAGCAALAPHPRNRSDAELRAVADGGGVTGIFVMPYLAKGRQPTAADVIAHIEHALKVAGSDHVAIGTDGVVSPTAMTPEFVERFRGIVRMRREQGIAASDETEDGYLFAQDLNEPRRLAMIGERLRARGHALDVVDKVLGGNFARALREAWSVPAA